MISVEGVSKKYKKQVLRDISFEAQQGQCIGIIGTNGCGKTTLLNILAGVCKEDSGKIKYTLGGNAAKLKDYVGYVPQGNPLIEELSVKDNLKLWHNSNNKALKRHMESSGACKFLGIDKYIDKTVSKLSGGMKRRLSIAIALINDARVLILDEPSAALDLVCKVEIMDYIKEYTRSGGIVILTTHDEREILLCDIVYIIKDGKLEEIPKGLAGEKLVNKLKEGGF